MRIRTYPEVPPPLPTPEDDRRVWYGEPPECRALRPYVMPGDRFRTRLATARGWRRDAHGVLLPRYRFERTTMTICGQTVQL